MSITIEWRGIMGNIREEKINDVHSIEMSNDDFRELLHAKELQFIDVLDTMTTEEIRDLLLFDDRLQNRIEEALKQVKQEG